jgi:hypothetical protein
MDSQVSVVARLWAGLHQVLYYAGHIVTLMTHPASHLVGNGILSRGYKSWGMKLTIHLNVVPINE